MMERAIVSIGKKAPVKGYQSLFVVLGVLYIIKYFFRAVLFCLKHLLSFILQYGPQFLCQRYNNSGNKFSWRECSFIQDK